MVKRGSQAIYMRISYGPTFGGGHDIHIADNAGHYAYSYTNFGHSFLAPSEVKEKVTVLAGTYHFTADEVEVFYLPLSWKYNCRSIFVSEPGISNLHCLYWQGIVIYFKGVKPGYVA